MKNHYKKIVSNILNQVIEDQMNNKIPSGFAKIRYLDNLIDKFCEASQKSKNNDKRLIRLMDYLEEKGFNFSI